jgi:hypothetical protein
MMQAKSHVLVVHDDAASDRSPAGLRHASSVSELASSSLARSPWLMAAARRLSIDNKLCAKARFTVTTIGESGCWALVINRNRLVKIK